MPLRRPAPTPSKRERKGCKTSSSIGLLAQKGRDLEVVHAA
jgi:hypothetical protein